MRSVISLILFAFLLTSCGSSTSESISLLEGYWSIEEVILADGSEREFPFTNHLDHFEINGSKGVKSRVSPTYDGSMINYGSPVPFQWKEMGDSLLLIFKEGEQAYQQTIKKVDANTLVLLHENGTEYTYQKFEMDEE
ncbi:lipocalin-like domain-containing protein [Nonlabens xiamenensis]|uniref:lipocalin family protein n=1 Tax=Nonlabens xiamenensis TaxID=2341043 RepID=UPI000F60D132|nr:lipocalin family protein [Nonlabens xiamenensis]